MKIMLMLILFLGAIIISLPSIADTFLVWQFTENVRVVLKQTPGNCKKGNQAVAQRMDGAYIPGCWTYEPNPELIRVTWHNGDFAILRMKDFTPVKE